MFISSILSFIVLIASITSGGGAGNWFMRWLIRISELTKGVFTFGVDEDQYFKGTIILLIGVISIIINYFSKIFPAKLNFLILPLISIFLVLLFGVIFPIFSQNRGSMEEGLAIALYMGTAIVFQIIFSLVVSLKSILKR